eukprot:gene19377-6612_t
MTPSGTPNIFANEDSPHGTPPSHPFASHPPPPRTLLNLWQCSFCVWNCLLDEVTVTGETAGMEYLDNVKLRSRLEEKCSVGVAALRAEVQLLYATGPRD